LGDFNHITALLRQIQGRDAALDETLAQWAYNYDLEAFAALCSWADGQNRTEP
jgi:hypothetical protein